MNGYIYRRDNRTDEQFARDIKQRTKKQCALIKIFQEEMKFRGKDILVIDYGIDNAGNVVKGNVGCNADYLMLIDNKVTKFLELQATNVDFKATFKLKNLQSYAKQGVIILLFLNTNDDSYVTKDTRWTVIKNVKIKEMLQDKKPYKDPIFGNKECIKISKGEFHKYFETHRLLHLQ